MSEAEATFLGPSEARDAPSTAPRGLEAEELLSSPPEPPLQPPQKQQQQQRGEGPPALDFPRGFRELWAPRSHADALRPRAAPRRAPAHPELEEAERLGEGEGRSCRCGGRWTSGCRASQNCSATWSLSSTTWPPPRRLPGAACAVCLWARLFQTQ